MQIALAGFRDGFGEQAQLGRGLGGGHARVQQLAHERGHHLGLDLAGGGTERRLAEQPDGFLELGAQGDDLGRRDVRACAQQRRDRAERAAVPDPVRGQDRVQREQPDRLGELLDEARLLLQRLGQRPVPRELLADPVQHLDRADRGLPHGAQAGLGVGQVQGARAARQRCITGGDLGGERRAHEGFVGLVPGRGQPFGQPLRSGLDRGLALAHVAALGGLLDRQHVVVELLGEREQRRGRLQAHGEIALGDWNGDRHHPVVRAVLRQVLDVRGDRPAGFEELPERAEHRARHVRMPDDVVRAADQLVALIAADPHEHVVGHADVPLAVRRGHEQLVDAEGALCGRHLTWHIGTLGSIGERM